MTPQPTISSAEEIIRATPEFGSTSFRGGPEPQPSLVQAPALERQLERIETICSSWAPDRSIDVEEMLRQA